MEPRPKVSTLLLDFLGFIRKYLEWIYMDMISSMSVDFASRTTAISVA